MHTEHSGIGLRDGRASPPHTATFSIPPGRSATIELKLNAAGRALLNADPGRLTRILQ